MSKTLGIIAGSFDVIHPGYIYMFVKARDFCDELTVALQIDPTIERPNKLKPILSYSEREVMLLNLRSIDKVIAYNTEKELENILKNNKYHVRILGDDYINKYATGQEYSNKIAYIDRNHGWSTTKYKHLICKSLHGENK